MIRSLIVLSLAFTTLRPMLGTTPTIYAATPFPVIAPTSTTTFQSSATIPTAPGANSFALSPDGKTVYFTTGTIPTGNNSIIAVDLATGKTFHTYQTQYAVLPLGPSTFAVLPNESQLWVATCSSFDQTLTCYGGYVEVFDVTSGRQLAALSMGSDEGLGVVAAPNGATVYAVHAYNFVYCCGGPNQRSSAGTTVHQTTSVPSNAVTAIDVASLQPGASFVSPDGATPNSMVAGAGSRTGYVLGVVSGEFTYLYAIDLPLMTLKATIVPPPTLYFGGTIMISRDGAVLAAQLGGYSPELVFFDTATGAVTQTVQGVAGSDFSISPHGNIVYFVTYDSIRGFLANLNTVDVQSGTVSTVASGEDISQTILSPGGKLMYLILTSGSGVVAAAEGGTAASKLFDVGVTSSWLAVSPNGQTLYSAGENGVWALSTSTGEVTSKFLDGVNVAAVAVSHDGSTLYALSADSFSLAIVNATTGAVESSIAIPKCS